MTIFETSSYSIVLTGDVELASSLKAVLSMKVESFVTADNLLEQAHQLNPISIFVDLQSGDQESDLEIIKKLRAVWSFAPLLVLTTSVSEELLGNALAAGADDFLKKPLEAKELKTRVGARIREKSRFRSQFLKKIGDVEIDTHHNTVSGNGQTRYLSKTDILLLTYLVEATGDVIPRSELKLHCWGRVSVSNKALDRKIHIVRAALADVSETVRVRSVYGRGFKVEGFFQSDGSDKI